MKQIHVAVGIVQNSLSYFLVAQRPPHKPFAGYWEFPGGKVESQETVSEALIREFQEEVNITPITYRPLIQVEQNVGDKIFLLDAWIITAYEGQVHANEQQAIAWVTLAELQELIFPPANAMIIDQLIDEMVEVN